MSQGLRVDLLGPPRITVDGAPLQVDTRKAVAVLAVLSLDGPQSRGNLAALLWPESDTTRARGALRRTLSVLSRGLGDRWLVNDRDRVLLQGAGLSSDVADVAAHLETVEVHGEPADARCDACLSALDRAATLHRGELLEGFGLRDSPEFGGWVTERAEFHRRQRCHILDLMSRAAVGRRDLDATIRGLEEWLAVDPLNEQVHHRLMLVHAWRGERSEAIHRYRACVATLDRELGVAPLPRTTQLYRAILEGRVPVMTTQAAAVPPADLTVGQLRTTSPGPSGASDGWPLVGRDSEVEQLLAIHDSAEGGTLLVITGEAGVGKTRLADELGTRVAARGTRTASARCYLDEADLTFGVIVDLLRHAAEAASPAALAGLPARTIAEARRLVPNLLADLAVPSPPPLDSPGARALLFEAIWDTLEAALAGERPGLVFMDELQAADPSTLELLGYGLRRLATRSLTVVVALRREDSPQELLDLLDDPVLIGVRHAIDLDRLPAAASAVLVEAVLGQDAAETAVRLHAQSEGLPLLLVEYLRLIIDGEVDPHEPDWVAPKGARELVRSRLAGLSEPAQQVASTAAVIGRSFDLAVVLRASGRSEEEVVDGLDELLARRLIREVPTAGTIRYDFAHEQLRGALYESTTVARQRLLHGRVADALAAGTRRPSDAGALASVIGEHAFRAGRHDQAATWFVHAGEHARSLFANQEALEHLERAVGLGQDPSWRLRTTIGELRTLVGDYTGAIAMLEAAAAQATDPPELAKTEHLLGTVHLRRGAIDAAAAHLEGALGLVGPDPALRSRVEADLGLLRLRTGDVDAATGRARMALQLAESADDIEAQAQALNLLGVIARHVGDAGEARRCLERSVKLATALDDPTAHIAALNNLALASADDGDLDRAIELQQLAVEGGARRGDRHREAALRNNLADLLHLAGREPDAMAALQLAVELFAGVDEAAPPTPEIWKLVDW